MSDSTTQRPRRTSRSLLGSTGLVLDLASAGSRTRPEALPEPLVAIHPPTETQVSILSGDAQYGLLIAKAAKAPATGTELTLIAGSGDKALHIVVEVIGQATAPPHIRLPAFAARWVALACRDRTVLTTFLRRALGMQASVTSDEPVPDGLTIEYDALRRLVRLRQEGEETPADRVRRSTTARIRTVAAPLGMGATAIAPGGLRAGGSGTMRRQQAAQRPEPDADDTLAAIYGGSSGGGADPQFGLKVGDGAAVGVRVGGMQRGESPEGQRITGRHGARSKPVYKRPTSNSQFRFQRRAYPCVFGWVGEDHVLFVMGGLTAPKVGERVEVAVPIVPVGTGQVWVTGTVSQLTYDKVSERTRVELDLTTPDANVPSVYRRLVQHCARTA